MLGEPLLVIHKHDVKTQEEKGKGKSIPESEDDIEEDVQKVLDQSIRKSPIAPNAIIPPRIGLLLNQSEMITTTMASTETVGFTLMTPASQEWVKQAYDKTMKKYKPPEGIGPPGGKQNAPRRRRWTPWWRSTPRQRRGTSRRRRNPGRRRPTHWRKPPWSRTAAK
jgi:hypothetical protein